MYKYTDREVLREASAILILKEKPLRHIAWLLGVPLSTLHFHVTKRLALINPAKARRVARILKTHKTGRKRHEIE